MPDYYKIYQSTDDVTYTEVKDAPSSPATFTLSPGVYYIRVKAHDSRGLSAFSEYAVARFIATPATPTATDNAYDIRLNITKPPQAAAYEVQQKIGAGEWNMIATGQTGSTYTPSQFTGNAQFRVRGTAENSTGAWSNPLSYTAPVVGAPGLTVSQASAGANPVLTVTAGSGASGYRGYKDGAQIFETSSTGSQNAGAVTAPCDFRVDACKGYTRTSSSTVHYVPLHSAANITFNNLAKSMTVTVNKPAYATGIEIQSSTDNSTWNTIYTGATTTITPTAFTGNMYFRYRLSDGTGHSIWSTSKQYVAPVLGNFAVTTSWESPDKWKVSWGSSSNALAYDLTTEAGTVTGAASPQIVTSSTDTLHAYVTAYAGFMTLQRNANASQPVPDAPYNLNVMVNANVATLTWTDGGYPEITRELLSQGSFTVPSGYNTCRYVLSTTGAGGDVATAALYKNGNMVANTSTQGEDEETGTTAVAAGDVLSAERGGTAGTVTVTIVLDDDPYDN